MDLGLVGKNRQRSDNDTFSGRALVVGEQACLSAYASKCTHMELCSAM